MPVAIEDRGRRDGDRMHIAVRNTGACWPPTVVDGIGLRNCRERLELLYGDDAQLELTQHGDAVEARLDAALAAARA